jgi:GT2 family glycosyltransferase
MDSQIKCGRGDCPEMIESSPLISFVVSNYNGLKLGLIRDCLLSLKDIDYENYEVIVVDNGSTDGSTQGIRDEFASFHRLKVVENPVNIYSKGLNLGLTNAKGDLVVLLNNDLVVRPDYARSMTRFFKERPRLVIAMGKIMCWDNRMRIDRVGDSMDLSGNPWLIGSQELDSGQFNSPMEILSAGTTAACVRRTVVKEIGMFDESYHIGYEDMDLALRAHIHGDFVLYNPGAVVYHRGAATDSRREMAVTVKFHFDKNRVATLIKNYEATNMVKALTLATFFYALAFLGEIFAKKNPDYALARARAVGWVIMTLPLIVRNRREVQQRVRQAPDTSFLRLMRKNYSLLRMLRDFRS